MKKINFIALAILILPLSLFAAGPGGQGGSGGGVGPGTNTGGGTSSGTQDQIQDRDQTRDRIQDPTTHTGDEPLQTRDQERDRLYQTSTTSSGTSNQNQFQGSSSNSSIGSETSQNQKQYQLRIDPEHIQYRAGDANQLNQMIQVRERELEREVASTSGTTSQVIVRNMNQVRLAVFAILTAQNMIGPAGPEIASVASDIGTSLQDVANAEVQIRNRGFWARFFFGGDSQAAAQIERVVNKNQEHINTLAKLMSQASVSPEVRSEIESQIRLIQQEQERLRNLSQNESNNWGLLSWRF